MVSQGAGLVALLEERHEAAEVGDDELRPVQRPVALPVSVPRHQRAPKELKRGREGCVVGWCGGRLLP